MGGCYLFELLIDIAEIVERVLDVVAHDRIHELETRRDENLGDLGRVHVE